MKTINKTKVLTIAFLSLSSLGFTQTKLPEAVTKKPIEFELIGKQNNCPVFELKTNNAEESKYRVSIAAADGAVLYSEVLKGKSILRKYQLDISEADLNDNLNVRFTVSKVNTNETFTYNVTRDNLRAKDIIVAKL